MGKSKLCIQIGVNMEERIKWLDTAKGVGIILVILGHAVTTAIREDSQAAMLLYNLIYFFHMPFLLYLSGYGYRLSKERYLKLEFKDFVKKRAKALLIPYVTYSLLVYLFFTICNYLPYVGRVLWRAGYGGIPVTKWLYDLIRGDNFYSIHLWYIYALFFMTILSFLLHKLFHNTQVFLVAAVLLLILTQVLNLEFLGAFCKLMFYYIWFALGVNFDLRKVSKLQTMIAFVSSLAYVIYRFIYLGSDIDLSGRWDITILNIILKIGFVIVAVKISFLLAGKVEQVFHFFGENSFGIYLFHQPFFGSCLGTFLYGFLHIPMLLVLMITVTLSMICPLIIVKILRCKYAFIFSKLLLGIRSNRNVQSSYQ
jgi:fucose 4-O-acetylase-like acetyltransferase